MQAPPLSESAAPRAGPATLRPGGWIGGLRQRVRERSFWLIQAGVLLVTVVHWTTETATAVHDHGQFIGVLIHVPVILYVVPVGYAALRYGFEGGLLTGLWAVVLAVPNMLVFHGDGYGWLGEFLLLTLVVGLGAVVALVVERERVHRTRAARATTTAAAARERLELVSELSTLPVRVGELHRELCPAFGRLLRILGLSAAAVIVRPTITDHPAAEVVCGRHDLIDRALHAAPHLGHQLRGQVAITTDAISIGLGAGGGEHRTLLVVGHQVPRLSPQDRALLETIAVQVGTAYETLRLQEQQHQRWRLYLRQATRAQEDERRRLARDLHDVAVHELLLLRRRLQDVPAGPGASEELPHALDEVQRGLAAVTEQLRRFSGALRPTVLTHLGLPAALESLATEVADRAALDVPVEVEGTAQRLPDEDELALFRVAEEALRNVERHAAAASATVRLTFHPAVVCLEVEDDGVGFTMPGSLEDLAQHGRLGLLGMRERAELCDGHLRVTSSPSDGTRVSVQVPVGEQAGAVRTETEARPTSTC
jgi:signal transduction histidine kinase